MKNLSARWQKLIVWLTGYVNIIAFVIAGGYLFKNTEYGEVKTSAKVALVVTAIFTAIEMVLSFIRNCLYIAGEAPSWLNKMSWAVVLVKIVVFVVLLIIDMAVGFGKSDKKAEDSAETEEN